MKFNGICLRCTKFCHNVYTQVYWSFSTLPVFCSHRLYNLCCSWDCFCFTWHFCSPGHSCFLTSYKLYRHDRSDGYGGVFIAVNSAISCQLLQLCDSCELCAVTLCITSSNQFLFQALNISMPWFSFDSATFLVQALHIDNLLRCILSSRSSHHGRCLCAARVITSIYALFVMSMLYFCLSAFLL